MHSSHKAAFNYNRSIRNDLRILNKPLQGICGLSLLSFRRFYNSGELIYLVNNKEWLEYSFAKQYWHSDTFNDRVCQLDQQKYVNYVWPKEPFNDPFYRALYEKDIWNGITLYRRYRDCIEAFSFSSDKTYKTMRDFYAHNTNVLNDFIFHFKEKAHHLSHPTDISIMIPSAWPGLKNHKVSERKTENFFKDTKITKYFLQSGEGEVPITRREGECLFHLSQGKSLKQAASLIKISPHTVETHLNNAKAKTGLSRKALIDVFLNSKFIVNLLNVTAKTTNL